MAFAKSQPLRADILWTVIDLQPPSSAYWAATDHEEKGIMAGHWKECPLLSLFLVRGGGGGEGD